MAEQTATRKYKELTNDEVEAAYARLEDPETAGVKTLSYLWRMYRFADNPEATRHTIAEDAEALIRTLVRHLEDYYVDTPPGIPEVRRWKYRLPQTIPKDKKRTQIRKI